MADEIKTVKLGWLDYFKLLVKGRPAVEEMMNQGKLVAEAGRTSGIKTLGFWMTALTALGAIGAQAGGLIPQPYGAVVLAASSLFYSLSRGLVKRDDPLGGMKPGLATSEGIGNVLASLAQVAMSATGVVDPKTAAILITVHAAAVAASQSLAQSGAQPGEGK